jgi:hypothetical protein
MTARFAARTAAVLAAAALLQACSGARAEAPASAPAASPGAAAAASASGPANLPVAEAGRAGAIPLDDAQRRALDGIVKNVPGPERKRLRYALASDDSGARRLVVYDGGGLGPDGRDPRRPREYVMFKVLNASADEHYDPQQNSVVAPIPPPVQRDSAVSVR